MLIFQSQHSKQKKCPLFHWAFYVSNDVKHCKLWYNVLLKIYKMQSYVLEFRPLHVGEKVPEVQSSQWRLESVEAGEWYSCPNVLNVVSGQVKTFSRLHHWSLFLLEWKVKHLNVGTFWYFNLQLNFICRVIEENPEKNNKELTEEMAWEERQYIKSFSFFFWGF